MEHAKPGVMFFVCLLCGTGIGTFLGYMEAGGTMGLGAGLISVALLRKK